MDRQTGFLLALIFLVVATAVCGQSPAASPAADHASPSALPTGPSPDSLSPGPSAEVDDHLSFDFDEDELSSEDKIFLLFKRWERVYPNSLSSQDKQKRFEAFKANAFFPI
ncbi:hypothetical protein CASFOL_027245 [Castilleja foliolosa]|uniref:Cathepsin propeptide inhibitor domain-containing protein n=1 Tax=Castilleja foliolosa TaxID=1961234 RepID=A0ABD3CF72_9LAMI